MYVIAGGSSIKVKFFRIVNKSGHLWARLKVVSPKKVMYKGKVVDLTKLDAYSQNDKHGLYVGVEQGSHNKDSLYCKEGGERNWTRGHTGYFKLFNSLTTFQYSEIKELLGIDEDWDAEWDESEIVER